VRKHQLDLFSLFAGLIFVGFAVAYSVGAYTDLHVNPKLVLPLLLVGLGVAGLIGALVAQSRADKRVAAAALAVSLDEQGAPEEPMVSLLNDDA
jgi:uncharacterized YccA/Bax inhibitor family protein